MHRHDLEAEFLPELKGEKGLSDQPVLDLRRDLDGIPGRREVLMRQLVLIAYGLHDLHSLVR